MTDAPKIALQIKALRQRSGLSIRDIAARMGMSPSGYAHYENPNRFKESILPLPFAASMAHAMSGTGVSRDEVMALTGMDGRVLSAATQPVHSFQEAVTPYAFYEQESSTHDAYPALKAVFGRAVSVPATYAMAIDLPAFSLVIGDVVIVDLSRLPIAGDLCLVTRFDEVLAASETQVMRYLPPFLVGGRSDLISTVLRVDDNNVTIRNPIIGVIRGAPA